MIGYWTTSAVVAAVLLFGGVMDLLHGPEVLVGQFFIQTMHHSGYPLYLLIILGCWKLLGAIALGWYYRTFSEGGKWEITSSVVHRPLD